MPKVTVRKTPNDSPSSPPATEFPGGLSNLQTRILYHRDVDVWKWTKIARELGVSTQQAQTLYKRAKTGIATQEQRNKNAIEHDDPERAAQVLALLAGRVESLQKICEDNGFPEAATQALVKALMENYPNVFTYVAEEKTNTLLSMLDTVTRKALEALLVTDMTSVPPRDLAHITQVSIEKARLLRNEPTEILSIEDRRRMHEILPALIQELDRRGMTIDGDPVTGRQRILEAPKPEAS